MYNADRWQTLGYALDRLAPGDIYEFGVHQGGTLAACALARPERSCYAFDTFDSGMQGSTAVDGDYFGRDGLMAEPLAKVRAFFNEIGANNIAIIPGDVRRTLFSFIERPIALALVDLNIYEPTLAVLRWLGRFATDETIILVDDVGFSGVDRALADFTHERTIPHWEKDGYMARVYV
jgi:hypothetical protein